MSEEYTLHDGTDLWGPCLFEMNPTNQRRNHPFRPVTVTPIFTQEVNPTNQSFGVWWLLQYLLWRVPHILIMHACPSKLGCVSFICSVGVLAKLCLRTILSMSTYRFPHPLLHVVERLCFSIQPDFRNFMRQGSEGPYANSLMLKLRFICHNLLKTSLNNIKIYHKTSIKRSH